MTSITAYPLSWPLGWHRTTPQNRARGKFSKGKAYWTGDHRYVAKGELSMEQACRRVTAELQRISASRQVISSNVVLRLDGLPRSGMRAPNDPGVAVYWRARNGEPRCIAIDAYDKVEHNVAAIAATLEAMRAIERHGGAEIGQRAYTGFQALPAPGQDTAQGWRTVLGFDEGQRPPLEDVERAYRFHASTKHPDRGGNAEAFHKITEARDQARKELGDAR